MAFTGKPNRFASGDNTHLEYLLRHQQQEWEANLRASSTNFKGQPHLRYYKYPNDLMDNMENVNAMVFEIHDTNPQALETKRKAFGEVASRAGFAGFADLFGIDAQGQGFISERGTQKRDANWWQTGIENFSSAVAGVADLFAGALFGGAGGAVDIDPLNNDPDRYRRMGPAQPSFVEEVTGIKGGTKEVPARIYLYIPSNIEAEYGFEYESTNMSALDMMRLGKAVVSSNDKSEELTRAMGRKLGFGMVKIGDELMQKIPGLDWQEGTFRKYLEADQRNIVNPMALHLFKDVKRRSFNFAYTFLPKSQRELLDCYSIIHLFKYYSHPATSGQGRFLDYPAEFVIRFYQQNVSGKQAISGYLPMIMRCALTSIKVTYGEDSVMSTFVADTHGAPPTKIKLELGFDELEILTRDRFTNGDYGYGGSWGSEGTLRETPQP